jgi:hypothetical protein
VRTACGAGGMEASAARYTAIAEYDALAAPAERGADLDLLDHDPGFGTRPLKSRLWLPGGSFIAGGKATPFYQGSVDHNMPEVDCQIAP